MNRLFTSKENEVIFIFNHLKRYSTSVISTEMQINIIRYSTNFQIGRGKQTWLWARSHIHTSYLEHHLIFIQKHLEIYTISASGPEIHAQGYYNRNFRNQFLEATQMSFSLYQMLLKYLWRSTQRTGQWGELKRGTRVRSGTVSYFHYIDRCTYFLKRMYIKNKSTKTNI